MPQETSLKSENEARFDAPDEAAILQAFCRTRLTALPPGSRGLRAATEVLGALPAACNLGWPDMTVSAPQLFRMFRHAGLVSDEPTACDMPAALRLVASVCELVVQRSPRRWTVWFSRACDPEDALFISIRKAVTSAMLRRSAQSAPPESRPRPTSVRAERKRLATELERVRAELASLSERYVTAQAGIKSAQADAKAARAQTERANEDANATRAKMIGVQADAKAARAQTERANEDANATRAKMISAKADAKAARAQTQWANEEAAAARTQMISAQADAKAARSETARANEDAKAARAETARMSDQAKVAKAEAKTSNHKLKKLQEEQESIYEAKHQINRELDALRHKLALSTQKANKSHQVKLALEGKYAARLTKLQDQLADQQVASDFSEQQSEYFRDQVRMHADEASHLKTALDKIREVLALEDFDSSKLDTFVNSVEQTILQERAHTKHVAAMCALILDDKIAGSAIDYLRLVQRYNGVPEEHLGQTMQHLLPNLRKEILKSSSDARRWLKKQGVHLPPANIRLERWL